MEKCPTVWIEDIIDGGYDGGYKCGDDIYTGDNNDDSNGDQCQ